MTTLFENQKCRGSHALPRYVRTHVNARGRIEQEALCRQCKRFVPVEVVGGKLRRIAAHTPYEE